jgi:hypothetical protein
MTRAFPIGGARNDPATRAAFDASLEARRAAVPALERHCGSWIVVRRATGESVLEIFKANRATAESVNHAAYVVFTAAQWLGAFNAAIRSCAPDYGLAALQSLLPAN